jgi:hypothetical protein
MRAAIQELATSPAGEKVNDLTWNAESGILDVHVVDGDGEEIESALREAFSDGYRLVQDQYRATELRELAFALATDGVAAGVPIASVSTTANNSGLTVTLVETATMKREVPADREELRANSPVPLEFATTSAAPKQASGWRWGDGASFWGGSHIYNSAGVSCTSAFPVINRQPGYNAVAMLTADHCGGTGEAWRSGQAGSSNWAVGTLQSGNSGGSDIRRLSGQSYQGNTYAGNHNDGSYINMKGAYYPVTGDIVCPSGAFSGLACDAKVQSTNDVICYFGGSCYNNLVTVRSVSGGPLFGNGDSGGPVLVGAIGGGALQVGIISGINGGGNERPCNGIPAGRDRTCSSLGYFANVRAYFDNNPGWVPLTN